MQQIRFKKMRWFHLPVRIMGLLIAIAAIVLIVPACTAVAKNNNPAGDNLYETFLYRICAVFLWNWIAEKISD